MQRAAGSAKADFYLVRRRCCSLDDRPRPTETDHFVFPPGWLAPPSSSRPRHFPALSAGCIAPGRTLLLMAFSYHFLFIIRLERSSSNSPITAPIKTNQLRADCSSISRRRRRRRLIMRAEKSAVCTRRSSSVQQ